MKCTYCNQNVTEAYQIKKAVKPPFTYKRYEVLGYCCEECSDKGFKILIDVWKTRR